MFNTIKEWLKPGIGVKRWFLLGLLGVFLLIMGIVEIVRNRLFSMNYMIYFGLLSFAGLFLIIMSINEGLKSFYVLVDSGMILINKESREINSLMFEKKMQINGPRVVAMGGGTGLSTMLKGLKFYTSNVTAVVTVGDDGGGSGVLRNEMGILPPGDIRNCLVALANTHELMSDLMQYRFSDGQLKGQSFGNLFLAAMTGVSEDFEDAVGKMSSVLAITGKVLPVTLEDISLRAKLKDGSLIEGEHLIGNSATAHNPIVDISLVPENVKAAHDVIEEIKKAEAIILGPGSLFTSVLPNILIKDVAEAINNSDAVIIYVCNIMTQPGETDEYKVSDHVKAIMTHSGIDRIDYVIVNSKPLSDSLAMETYIKSESKEVKVDILEIEKLGPRVIEADLLTIKGGVVRHNSENLAQVINRLVMETSTKKGKISLLDYLLIQAKKDIMKKETYKYR